MGRDLMGYDVMVQDALRGMVRTALIRAASEGLPGEHHFFINFATGYPGVVMPDWLKASYPNDMIIVLQHQFWDLEADENGFSVTLQFNKMPQRLTVPYEAVISFADPSVQFGLRFQVEGYQPKDETGTATPPTLSDPRSGLPASSVTEPAASADEAKEEEPAAEDEGSAEVVNLDTFRKK